MVQLHKHLQFLTLLGFEHPSILFSQQLSHPFFRHRRGAERTKLLSSRGVGNELNDFFEWLHEQILG